MLKIPGKRLALCGRMKVSSAALQNPRSGPQQREWGPGVGACVSLGFRLTRKRKELSPYHSVVPKMAICGHEWVRKAPMHMPTQVSAAPVVSSQKPGNGAKPCATSPLEFSAVVHVIGPTLLAILVHAVGWGGFDGSKTSHCACVIINACMCVCACLRVCVRNKGAGRTECERIRSVKGQCTPRLSCTHT